MKQKQFIITIWICLIVLASCTKADQWLAVKGNIADVVPTSIKDYQAILDFDMTMNTGYPTLSVLSGDHFYLTDAQYASASAVERNCYTWQPDIYEGGNSSDWSGMYALILNANVVLEGLAGIPVTTNNQQDWNTAKGGALFFRSYAYYQLLQEFAPSYSETTAATDEGVPLRLDSYIHEKISRASVKECYDRIIQDLHTATLLLLPAGSPKTRPSKAACYMALAKIYLQKSDYTNTGLYADSALAISNSLLDFNTLSTAGNFSFPSFQVGNPEINFYAAGLAYSTTISGYADSILYKSYASNDLRKTLFYKLSAGVPQYRGSYCAGYSPFCGLAVNEAYLLRAEARARNNNTSGAMSDLNTLLIRRWKTGTYTTLTASSSDQALQIILSEKRKEMPCSGSSRWADLRRLNGNPATAVTLKRVVAGTTYSLGPNDARYVFPIPDSEIRLTGINQNPR